MSTNHTQGRLEAKPDCAAPYLNDQNDNPFAVLQGRTFEDARRLAACWNACEGFTTTELESLRVPLRHLVPADLARERDQLLQTIANIKAMAGKPESVYRAAANALAEYDKPGSPRSTTTDAALQRVALANAQESLVIAIGYLRAMLDPLRTSTQAADAAQGAAKWLRSIGCV